MQRGLAALNSKAPRSALAKSQGSGKKLQFAETLHYEACLGYQCPDVSVKDNAVHVNTSSAAASSQNSKEKGYLSKSESTEVLSHEQAQKDFEKMVDDMVYKFPEIGWDAVHDIPGNNNEAAEENWNQQEQMEDDQQEEQESMLINLSDSSASSVNVLDMEIVQQQQQGNVIVNIQVLNCEVFYPFVGHAPPPGMQWSRLMDRVLPIMQSKIIVAPLQGSLFAFLNKSAWNKGMVGNQHNLLQQGSGKTVEPKIKKKSRAKMLLVTSSSSDKEGTRDKKVEGETGETGDHIPVTPLHVMQRVGVALGIAPEKLTKEQLEADPKEAEPVEDTDDQ
ncbi:hypothetical protein ACQ4PT_059175 [Festuca glaucescens]